MITCGYRNGSSIPPVQVQDTPFFGNGPVTSHFPSIGHSFFFCSCMLVFGHVVSMLLLIVFLDDFRHIVLATVADFDCIAIENFECTFKSILVR